MTHDPQQQTAKLCLELRRGTLVLAVMSQLQQAEYAYSLRQKLLQQGLDIEEGTLYPLIRRLEQQGLLDSHWQEASPRARRYYALSDNGRQVLERLIEEWSQLSGVMQALIENDEVNES